MALAAILFIRFFLFFIFSTVALDQVSESLALCSCGDCEFTRMQSNSSPANLEFSRTHRQIDRQMDQDRQADIVS